MRSAPRSAWRSTAHWVMGGHVKLTNLVVDLVRGDFEVDGLFKDVAFLLELDALGPVVKGAGNVDFVCGVFPGSKK